MLQPLTLFSSNRFRRFGVNPEENGLFDSFRDVAFFHTLTFENLFFVPFFSIRWQIDIHSDFALRDTWRHYLALNRRKCITTYSLYPITTMFIYGWHYVGG